eukprot:jgi/Botrbrau1/11899/Bobra.0171s0010.1
MLSALISDADNSVDLRSCSSNAGAGSGEFHMYRMARRRGADAVGPYRRGSKGKRIERRVSGEAGETKIRRRARTAKRRAKRLKKKGKKKRKTSDGASGEGTGQTMEEEEDGSSDEDEPQQLGLD